MDKRWYGRMHMQANGFMMMFILYLICAVAYPQLTASQAGLHAFQFLYFFSSFWNQFGPNCTTWLVAGESCLHLVHIGWVWGGGGVRPSPGLKP